MKRRFAVFVARAGVRAAFDQRRNHGRVGIGVRRRMKRRVVVFVACAGVRTGRKRGLHFGSGSAFRRLEQSVRRVGMNGKRRQRQCTGKQDRSHQRTGVPTRPAPRPCLPARAQAVASNRHHRPPPSVRVAATIPREPPTLFASQARLLRHMNAEEPAGLTVPGLFPSVAGGVRGGRRCRPHGRAT